MERLLASNGADIDRRIPGGAEHIGLEIGFGDIHQAARAYLVMPEGFAVYAWLYVVIDAGGWSVLSPGLGQQRTSGEEAQQFTPG